MTSQKNLKILIFCLGTWAALGTLAFGQNPDDLLRTPFQIGDEVSALDRPECRGTVRRVLPQRGMLVVAWSTCQRRPRVAFSDVRRLGVIPPRPGRLRQGDEVRLASNTNCVGIVRRVDRFSQTADVEWKTCSGYGRGLSIYSLILSSRPMPLRIGDIVRLKTNRQCRGQVDRIHRRGLLVDVTWITCSGFGRDLDSQSLERVGSLKAVFVGDYVRLKSNNCEGQVTRVNGAGTHVDVQWLYPCTGYGTRIPVLSIRVSNR